MSSNISLWKRVGSAFRANVDHGNGNGKGNGIGSATVSADSVRERGRDPDNGSKRASSLLPWIRRGRSYQQLDERYQRVLELLDTMRDHFDRQDRRSEELSAGVVRLGGALEQLASTQQTQSESVASIAARVEDAVRHSAGLSSMIREMPASLQAQAEAMRAVAQQMEATRAADAELVSSLQRFGQAADSLRDAGSVQTATLQRLHDASGQQADVLRTFARSQTRLLLIVTIVVALLGAGAVTALGVVGRMVFDQ